MKTFLYPGELPLNEELVSSMIFPLLKTRAKRINSLGDFAPHVIVNAAEKFSDGYMENCFARKRHAKRRQTAALLVSGKLRTIFSA